MANDTHKPWRQDFDESTNVMESGLLRVLTDKSASVTGGWRALDEDLEAEVIIEPPTTPRTTPPLIEATPTVEVLLPLVATAPEPLPPVATAPPSLPPVPTAAPEPSPATPSAAMPSPPLARPSRVVEPTLAVALERPARRRSGIMTVALAVAVVVLAADVAMYTLHQRQLAQQPPPAPPPLPTYMVLPKATPPALLQPVQTVHAVPEVAPEKPSVAPAPPPADAKPHGRHHRHAKSTR